MKIIHTISYSLGRSEKKSQRYDCDTVSARYVASAITIFYLKDMSEYT
jgi:hypothetical protein